MKIKIKSLRNISNDFKNSKVNFRDTKVIMLPDLEKKLSESITDAIIYFKKKCPYCNSDLYSGNIRDKIEIDHYIPIEKGGQNVPWNILPVCKKCNRKKSNKLPKDFLDKNLLDICDTYLDEVREKYVCTLQKDLECYYRIKSIMTKLEKNKTIISEIQPFEILSDISDIMELSIFSDNYSENHFTMPEKERKVVNMFHKLFFYNGELKNSEFYELYKKGFLANKFIKLLSKDTVSSRSIIEFCKKNFISYHSDRKYINKKQQRGLWIDFNKAYRVLGFK